MGSCQLSTMVNFLSILCIVGNAQSFLLVSNSIGIPTTYVCPSFPFCYQDLRTGLWKKDPTNLGTSARVIESSSSACLRRGVYCRSVASTRIKTLEADNPEQCKARCKEDSECSIFSFHKFRGVGVCALLSSCEVSTPCAEEESCAIGRATCQCPALKYLPGTKDSVEYARWTCREVDPYSSNIPEGTTCTASCPTWKFSALQSTCLPDGSWSQTVTSSGRTFTYSSPFPTPDQPDLECGCEDIGPFNYDPNDEEGAVFVCQGSDKERFKEEGGWSLKHDDKCDLFCSDEPAVSVFCEAKQWKGEPEKGFWCYDSPKRPGPGTEDI